MKNTKIKPIKQRDSIGCGPASIKMVSDYLGTNISMNKINQASKYKERDGLSNTELAKTLEELGFAVKEKNNASWEDLKNLNTKENVIILSWMQKGYLGHFSVLEKVTKDRIFLADPECGEIISMQKIIFLRLWFDYDELWYPEKNTDIQLRWLIIVSKK